ncbi:MAG TPA: hypothetical protein VKX28_27045 [Xanthobacteraceae bacterium]|nr:hypothetical protein [Xanthobacteraceae bacterium]
MSMSETIERDWFVTRIFGSTKCFLRVTPEGTECWTPSQKRARRYGSQALAAAAAAEHNQHASTPAVVEQE